MLRILVLFLLALIGSTNIHSAPPSVPIETVPESDSHSHSALLRALGVKHSVQPFVAACCKVCRVGKACGNTCISRSKTCHVGTGCACDE
jgi:hypothetical protein